jgi:hypothetical protein
VSTVYDLNLEQLTDRMVAWDEPTFRAKQIWSQLWKRAATYDVMSEVAPALRERLGYELPLGVEVLDERTADRGATRKALLKLGGQHVVEAVLMGYPDRVTVCISSQAGCAMGCMFCATGQMGLQNNLTAGEISAQAVWARREAAKLPASTPQRLTNIVFMGMGEPIGGCLLPSRSTNTSSGPYTVTSVMFAKDPSTRDGFSRRQQRPEDRRASQAELVPGAVWMTKQRGETAAESLRKGATVTVEDRLQTRTWDAAPDSSPRRAPRSWRRLPVGVRTDGGLK